MNNSPVHFLNRAILRRQGCCATTRTTMHGTFTPRYEKSSMISNRRATKRMEEWLPQKYS